MQNRIESVVSKTEKSNMNGFLNSSILFNALLFLLFASSFVAAQSAESKWNQYVPAWFPLFAVALLIGYGLTAIAFMLSRVFQTAALETWARLELFEVTSSAFLVLIVLIALAAVDSLFVAVTGTTPIASSLDFTDSLTHELGNIYVDSIMIGFATGIFSGPPAQYLSSAQSQKDPVTGQDKSGATARFAIAAISLFDLHISNPFSGADLFNSHFNLVQSIVFSSLMITVFSNALLSFVNNVAIPVAIPFGLLLSMFTFTRKMGRTLIAFGVGLYLFVPLSIMISQAMYESAYKTGTYVPAVDKPGDIDSFVSSMIWFSSIDFLLNLAPLFVTLLSGGAIEGIYEYIPECITGGVSLSAVCGIVAPVCAPVFTLVCGIIRNLFDQGQSLDNLQNFMSLIQALRIGFLGNILGVDVWGWTVPIALPSIPSAVALVSRLLWPSTGVTTLVPNLISIVGGVLASVFSVISNTSLLGAYLALNKALALKISNISLDYTPYVMQYAVPVMLFPFIIIFIVVTGIRSISPAIGGEVQILGVSELI